MTIKPSNKINELLIDYFQKVRFFWFQKFQKIFKAIETEIKQVDFLEINFLKIFFKQLKWISDILNSGVEAPIFSRGYVG